MKALRSLLCRLGIGKPARVRPHPNTPMWRDVAKERLELQRTHRTRRHALQQQDRLLNEIRTVELQVKRR